MFVYCDAYGEWVYIAQDCDSSCPYADTEDCGLNQIYGERWKGSIYHDA